MADEKHDGHDAAHDHGAPVPKFLLLVYLVIAAFFVYYLATGLKFGGNSPTGF
ncbi:MAG TPA: hypothetical protein VD973_27555 [Symbiobacteriaceae bacterium]|jgi:hypothetical protein|nr:hypothetical protein [Symbiobacteriaceae bacterium]